MDRLVRRRTRVLGLAAGLGSLLLLTGCGGVIGTLVGNAGTSSAPAASPTTATASPSVEPTPSQTPEPSPTPELVSGTKKLADGRLQVTDAETGYQLTLPRGYSRITNRAQLEQILRAGSKAIKAKVPLASFTKNVKLFSIDKLTGTSINLIVTPANGMIGSDLPGEAEGIATSIKATSRATAVKTRPITVAGDQALRLDAVTTFNGVRVRTAQVYAISDDQFFVLTFSGNIPEATVKGVLASVRFTG